MKKFVYLIPVLLILCGCGNSETKTEVPKET